VAQAFIGHLGLTPQTMDRIQRLPWTDLLAAQSAMGAHAFAPVIDGSHIPTHPFGTEAAALLSDHVPLIVSTTLDDAGLFFDRLDMTEQELADALSDAYGAQGAILRKVYREYYSTKSPCLLHAQIITDAGFRRFAHAQAESKAARQRAAVYAYLWKWACPAFDGKFGAVHAMDASASMHNDRDAILGSGSADARAMCAALASAWLAFAKTGDPNNHHIPDWRPFDSSQRATLVFQRNTKVENDPDAELRKLWIGTPMPATIMG
jgi:para-nitrobenzyl esterase